MSGGPSGLLPRSFSVPGESVGSTLTPAAVLDDSAVVDIASFVAVPGTYAIEASGTFTGLATEDVNVAILTPTATGYVDIFAPNAASTNTLARAALNAFVTVGLNGATAVHASLTGVVRVTVAGNITFSWAKALDTGASAPMTGMGYLRVKRIG